MKTIIFTLIIFTFNFSYSQSTLQVNTKNCLKNSNYPIYPEFKVFKNDSIIDLGNFKFSKNKHILENLEFGEYRIEYQKVSGETENVKIKLTKIKKYIIDLCVGTLYIKS